MFFNDPPTRVLKKLTVDADDVARGTDALDASWASVVGIAACQP